MIFLRPFFAIFFALILAVTGQSMAVARGASDPAGQMVLCTGNGPVTVYMDADGNPAAAPHMCPDCLASGFDALAAADPATEGTVRLPLASPAKCKAIAERACILAYLSRAPPIPV